MKRVRITGVAVLPDDGVKRARRGLLAILLLSILILGVPGPALSDVVPASPARPDLLTADDTGFSRVDDTTSVTRPRFTVRTAPGLLVELVEGDAVLGSASSDVRTGVTTIQVAQPLDDGVHEVAARARLNAASTAGPLSAALSVTIDTIAPAVPVLDLPSEEDTGVSKSDNETKLADWHIYASLDGAVTILTHEQAPNGRDVTYEAGPTWSFFPDPEGGTGPDGRQGTWTYTARGIDLAGNTSATSAPLAIVFDSIAPAMPSRPDLLAADDSGAADDDDVTNVAQPRFDVEAESGALLTLFADNSAIVSGADLADGPHAISAQAGDRAGNLSAPSVSMSLLVDTTKPAGTVEVNAGVPGVRNPEVSVALAFADAHGPRERRISTDGAASWDEWAAYGETAPARLPGADGTKTVVAEVRDLAGNVGSASDDIVLDRTGPAITLNGPLAGRTLDVSDVVDFVFSATDVSDVASSSSTLDAHALANESAIDAGLLLAGTHRIVITATDSLENTSTQVVVFTVHASIDGLIHEVDEGVAGELRAPLLAKLDAAQTSLDRGARTAAKGQLGAFCNQLRAQSGKKVDAAGAARLVNWAQDLSASL